MAESIESKLSNAGFKMLGTNEIENLILSILKSKNNRFLKAIPYLIYLHKPDLKQIENKTDNKKSLKEIIAITRKIFEEEKIKNTLQKTNTKIKLPYIEFKEEFDLQISRNKKSDLLIEKEKIYAERNLQMWLSQIFTKKEKDIINNILNENKLNKTEYEYYSRKTKKKLNAIVNLKDFAKTVLPISPKIN